MIYLPTHVRQARENSRGTSGQPSWCRGQDRHHHFKELPNPFRPPIFDRANDSSWACGILWRIHAMLLRRKSDHRHGGRRWLRRRHARVCHREGARVIVSDIDGPRTSAVAASLERSAVAMQCDIARMAIAKAGRSGGRAVRPRRRAGQQRRYQCVKPLLETTPDDWQNVLAINLRTPFLLSQMVIRQMLRQQPAGGSIVNVASVHTHGGPARSVTYDAAKWGLVGMTKSMAIDMAPQGIRINAVSPGLVATQIWEDVKCLSSIPQCEDWLFPNIPINRPISRPKSANWSPLCSAIAVRASSVRTSLPMAACRDNLSAAPPSSSSQPAEIKAVVE